jgi:TetR/AcrR family tetracycline transcriptional repressor
MLAHREAARVVAGAHLYPAVTLARISEACLQALHAAGIDLLEARTIAMTVIHFTFGHVIEEQASPSQEELRQINLEDMKQSYPLMATALQRVLVTDQADVAVFEGSLRLILHRYL